MSRRRLLVSAFAAVLIASGAVAVAAAVGSPSNPHQPAMHQDYLQNTGPGPGADQCGKPVASRTGAWFCPPDSSR